MTVLLGTLWTSIKQIKAPYMFDGEHGIALYAMQGKRASSHGEGDVSWFFSSCCGIWGIFSSYRGDRHLKLMCVQRCQDSFLVTMDTSGISTRLGRAIRTHFEVRRETEGPFLVSTLILGFLSIFKKSQSSSPFETLNSAWLSRCQRDVNPPVHMRQASMAFSRVSTLHSEISSYEMKDEPALKILQGNLVFLIVRASQCPFHLRQQTQDPSHIPIGEGSLLLRWFCKVCLPLQLEPGNMLSSVDAMFCTEFYSSCCAEIGVLLDLRRGSQGISGVA